MPQDLEHILLVTTKQAAEALQVCEKTIFNLMCAGQLQSLKIGTSRRIELAAIRRFIKERREDTFKMERGGLTLRLEELEAADAALQGTEAR
jgi:excisionase family DNA binding protein